MIGLGPTTGRGKLAGRMAAISAVAVAALSMSVQIRPASALGAPQLQNSQIDIAYVPPSNSNYEPVYLALKQRQVLEELREFLAPLRLPRKILIRTTQCGTTNAWYESRSSAVTVCYEWVDFVARLAPVDISPVGFSRDEAIVGPFVQVVLHEVSHAVFDLLNVPVFGREEDAADELAAFVMLQFGKEVARRTLSGSAYFFQQEALARRPTNTDFSDVHGTDAQRFYNYLCIAYGGDPVTFHDFVDRRLLPPARAAGCGREYAFLRRAFIKTIWPFIDQDLLKIVQASQWLPPANK